MTKGRNQCASLTIATRRDRLRLDLALRFMRHEARTHTIRKWTGLTDDRIRKLYRSYLDDAPSQVPGIAASRPGRRASSCARRAFSRRPRCSRACSACSA